MFYKWLSFALFLLLLSCEGSDRSGEHILAIWTDRPGTSVLYINGQAQGTLPVYAGAVNCNDPLLVSFSFAEDEDYFLAVDRGAGLSGAARLRFYPHNTGVSTKLYNGFRMEILDSTGEACNELLLSW